MEVCRDSRDRMCYTVGNSAIVFRVRHEGRIRSLRCYMHPPRHLAEIYGERLLPQELYLYDSPRSGVWVDVVLGDWIEGTTLHEAVAEAAAAEDTARLRQLAAAFDRLAAGLTSDDWAHGDLKPENIVVDPSGRLHLIDLDAMYLPAFAGEASPELGTAAFQHPARTIRDFNASLDDYPAALISRPSTRWRSTLPCTYATPMPTGCSSRRSRSAPTRRSARPSRFSKARGWPCSTASRGCCMHPRPVCSGCRSCWHAQHGLAGRRPAGTKAQRQPEIHAGTKAAARTAPQAGILFGIQGAVRTNARAGRPAASRLRTWAEAHATTARKLSRNCSSGTACGVTGHRSRSSYLRSTTAGSTLPKGLPPSGWAEPGIISTPKGIPGFDARGAKP